MSTHPTRREVLGLFRDRGRRRPVHSNGRTPRARPGVGSMSPSAIRLNTSTIRGQKLPIAGGLPGNCRARAGYRGVEPWVAELDLEAGPKAADRWPTRSESWTLGLFGRERDRFRRVDRRRRSPPHEGPGDEAARCMELTTAIGGNAISRAPPAGVSEKDCFDLPTIATRHSRAGEVGRPAWRDTTTGIVWILRVSLSKLSEVVLRGNSRRPIVALVYPGRQLSFV